MMLRTMLISATAVALTAGTAYADCSGRMDAANEDYGKVMGYDSPMGVQTQAVMRDLRSAAISLQNQGNEEGCEAVMNAMDTVIATMPEDEEEARKQREEARAKREATERAEIEARVVGIDAMDGTMNTSNLNGTNVYNYENEFLGEVDGLLVKSGSAPTHLIVGHGGFWNIGDEEAAIPIEQVKWDPEWEVFYIDMTEEQLDNAPDYDIAEGKWVPDENDGYYSTLAN